MGQPAQIIALWPPFTDDNHNDYKKLCDEFAYYCKNTNLVLKSYWHVGGEQLIAKYYTFEKQALLEEHIEKVNIGSLLRDSKFIVLWKDTDNNWILRLFSHVYPIFIEARHYGYWLKLLDDHSSRIPSPSTHFIVQNICECKAKRVAIICAGPSSELFLDETINSFFEEVILVNRVVYAEAYYARARKTWLCAYDRLFFSPVDETRPPFTEMLAKFLEEENHFFVTMSYVERFFSLNLPDKIYDKSLFLEPLPYWRGWNIDLCKQLMVKESANVTLTLALPLAARLADEIVIFGMDGSPPDSTESWAHGKMFRYLDNTLSDDVVRRPSFYKNTQQLVKQFEAADCQLYLASPSYNPGLAPLPIWQPPQVK